MHQEEIKDILIKLVSFCKTASILDAQRLFRHILKSIYPDAGSQEINRLFREHFEHFYHGVHKYAPCNEQEMLLCGMAFLSFRIGISKLEQPAQIDRNIGMNHILLGERIMKELHKNR